MTEDSIAAFKDTGLFQDFVGYCMKNQSSGGDYHGDGILNVEPPVYVIELYMGERYMGGSVTDQYMEAKTMADVLEMLEGYLGVNVTWEEDGNGIAVPDSDGNYNGTFVRDHIIYSVLVTQREKQLATEQLKDIQYIKRSNIYYQALFDISMTGVAMPVDYIVTYKDGVGGSVFYDHEYGAYAGETVPAFEGDPVWGEYIFRGWDLNVDGTDAVYSSEDLAAMIVEEDMVFTAVYEPIITFHANNDAYTGSDIFRVFYPTGTQVSDASFEWHMTAEKKIEAFYDIPEFAYSVHNGYIFKGWYLDKDNENDSRPISWDTVYTTSTDVYAHWITVGTVAKEEDYKILADGASSYSEFDLIGVQIRTLENDPGGYYGTPGSGLRFLCVLSENVYGQINALHANNASGADYGFVTAKTSTAQKYAAEAGNPTDYYLQYKGSNVNGIDTSTAFKYVKNSLCSGAGITDHYDGEAYRIYTVVITYANKTGDALAEAQAVEFLARAYLKYYDANGLERVHYHNYTGNSVYGGCSASYTWVASVLGSGGEVG
jgi:uncharacterized repeat protein (TIGR02543 family)